MTATKSSPTLLEQLGPGGTTGLIIGPPKTGKSTLLGSWGELVAPEHIRLICPKPQEVDSWLYGKYGLSETAEVFRDHRWMPAADVYEADGYLRLMRYILGLYADHEAKVVLLDPLTDAVQLAAHDLLKGERADNPRNLRDSISFYGALRYKLRDMVQALVGLSAKNLESPKHVWVAVHAQPTKEEDIKGKETAEGKGKGVQFFGDVLPMVEGGYRMDIAGEFSLVGYSSVEHDFERIGNKLERRTSYMVQFAPDQEKHGGIRLAPALTAKKMPNNMKAILEAIVTARKEDADGMP
jgi:hypothetical protein